MSLADEFILGNPVLHQQFCMATEILAALVAQAPHPIDMPSLERLTGHTAKELAPLCSSLWQTMLITPNSAGEGWVLITPAHRITLADVFRCVIESQKPRPANAGTHADNVRTRPDVEIFVSQATIAINQSVFQHLRQFPLSRLRFDGSGTAAFSPHFLNATSYDANSDLPEINLIGPIS